MKTLVSTIAALFFLLFVLTTFVPYPQAQQTALDVGFTQTQVDTGLQLTFERRLFGWGWTAVEFTLLGFLALTPLGRRVADRCLAWTGQRRLLAALAVGVLFALAEEVLYLPFGIARHYHTVAWGMSSRELPDWLRDHAISFGVNCAWQALLLGGFYALLIWLPRTWWLVAPLGAGAAGVVGTFLWPVLVNPLFNDFTPLEETQWKDLQPRVVALIDSAGVPVQEILVMDASRQTNHTNAYFTGFGATRRIVLYDTLLKKHTPEEIESILAHELGHWRHDHIVKGILLAMPAALLACFLLDRLLRGAVGRAPWNLQSTADPAALPLIILLFHLGSWIAMPAQNAVSRQFERQADAASLELAGRPKVFIEGEKKLASDNKSNVAPTPWNVWLYASHPPAVERIRMAQEWRE